MYIPGLNKYSLVTKSIILGWSATAVLMVILLSGGLLKIKQLADFTDRIYDHPLVVSNAIQSVNFSIVSMHRYMKDVTLARSEEELNTALIAVESEEKNVLKQLEIVAERYLGDINEIITLREDFIAWRIIRNKVIKLSHKGQYSKAAEITKNEGAEYVEFLTTKTNKVLIFARNKASEFLEESQRHYKSSNQELLILGGMVILFTAMFALSITYKIIKSQKKLVESEERFRTAFENVSVANIVIDSKGIIEVYNSSAEIIFGYEASEVVGQNVSMLMPKKYSEKHDYYLKRYLETGVEHIIGVGREVSGLRKSGVEFPMHLGIGEMHVGKKVLFIASISDLSDLKKLEVQLQKKQRMEVIGQLTGGVAHDFNNLLAIMMGNLEISLDKIGSDDKAYNNINNALGAVKKGAALTQQLLSYSGQQNLKPAEIDSGLLISETAEFLDRTLSENINIVIDKSEEELPVFIDSAMFGNAFLNLALNSRDAMPTGGEITISNTCVDAADDERLKLEDLQAGQYVLINFTDNGVGMDQNCLKHVFEPFFTTKEVGKGSGLGLSMVYGFIHQSNGLVFASSKKNTGTTISIYLPLVASKENISSKIAEQDLFEIQSKNILLVEDDVLVAETTAASLEGLGYNVYLASNAEQGLEFLQNNADKIAILITDIIMPGNMDGLDLAQKIKEDYPQLAILLISGYPDKIANKENLEQHKLLLLPKPFTRVQLVEAIDKVTKR